MITIDDKNYNPETFTDEQKEILNVIVTGNNTASLLRHALACVEAVNNSKVTELKASLPEQAEAAEE
jgi:hypothetical protein